MHEVVSPSRRSLAWSGLFFAVPLAFIQGATLFLWIRLSFPELWLVGTAFCYLIGGGFCGFRTTREGGEATKMKRGCLSGLLTGLLSSLLGVFFLVLLIIWYHYWWMPSLSPQSLHSRCVAPIACMSPQAGARFLLFFLPFEFLLANIGFIFLALLGGTLATRLTAQGRSIPRLAQRDR